MSEQNSEILENLTIAKLDFVGTGNWTITNRSPIMVIFGKNGSGKSVLLRQIRSQNPTKHHYCVPERAGDIAFQPNHMNEQYDGSRRANRSPSNQSPNYVNDVIARIQVYLSLRGASRNELDPKDLDVISESIQQLLPDFNLTITGKNPPFLLTRNDGIKINNSSEMSSGEVQLLTLGLDLLLICNMWKVEQQSDCLLLIDEPDTHLHPDLQQRFAKFLVTLYNYFKHPMMISTHSTTLLSALGYHGENLTSVIYLNSDEDIQKTIQFSDVLKKLSTCLGGHALMGPLFGFPIVLVEGDDDYKIWSEIPRHNRVKLSAIPCNGQEIEHFQKMLESLFTSLLENVGEFSAFALVDGDKKKPETTQKFVKYLQLNCHESENLYLTNEILSTLNHTWETACEKVILDSKNHGAKEDFLKSIKDWDRQSVDCKKVINELAKILDEKQLNWAHRLGKELGKTKPAGQLADFLGSEIVNIFWKE